MLHTNIEIDDDVSLARRMRTDGLDEVEDFLCFFSRHASIDIYNSLVIQTHRHDVQYPPS